jgi:predicted aldo/keto reductase-like oxidoreductase
LSSPMRQPGWMEYLRIAASGMTRREFLKNSALAAIGSRVPANGPFAQEAKAEESADRVRKGNMTYRRLGRTDLFLSEVGLGGSPPPPEPVFRRAIEMGVNYVDTSSVYLNGNSERRIGEILRGRRDRFHIATKFHFSGGWQDTRDSLIREAEGSLSRLKTDYVDILLVHNVSSVHVVEHEEVLAAFEKLKKEGKARYTGVSCHRNPLEVLTSAIRGGRYDMITVAYNAFSETFREQGEAGGDNRKTSGIGKILAFAEERGVGVVAMKTMAGVPRRNFAAYLGEGVSLPQAKLKWVLEDEVVSAVITEMDTFDMLEENLAVSGEPLSPAENEFLMRYVEAAGRDVCRLCGTCMPACPLDIPISDVLRCLQYYRDHGKSELARRTYRAIPAARTARICTRCGMCEQTCPYGVRVVHHLRQAHRVLV